MRKGVRAARSLVVVEALRQPATQAVRVGFTATRKVGNAVARNRAKRRLRAAAASLLPGLAKTGCDYVFIAREGTGAAPWPRLLDDVRSALLRLAPALDPGADAAESGAKPAPTSDENGQS